MSHKTKIGEEVTGETDEFLFCLSLVAIVRTALARRQMYTVIGHHSVTTRLLTYLLTRWCSQLKAPAVAVIR